MHVVVAADKHFVKQVAVAVRSLLNHCSLPLRVTILSVGLDETDEGMLKSSWSGGDVELRFVNLSHDKRLQDLPFPVDHLKSPAVYARLLLPFFVEEHEQRVIYLDSDVVVRDSLADLWTLDLEGFPLGAAVDPGIPTLSSPNGVAPWETLKLPGSAPYFNSGVLLIDLPAWSEAMISERSLAYLREYSDIVTWVDQEALNAVLGGEFKVLEPKWNVMLHWFYPPLQDKSGPVLADMRIRHYAGRVKPWDKDLEANDPKATHRNLWFETLDQTVWAGWRP